MVDSLAMKVLYSCLFSVIFFFAPLRALEICPKGRADIGATYFHIRLLEDREVTNKIDLVGARADSTILPFEGSGFCVKPFVYGAGGGGDLFGTGCGIGHYTPILKKVCLTPVVGYTYANLGAMVDINTPFSVLEDAHERFQSNSFYSGMELSFNLKECLSLTAIYQYAWAWTNTVVKHPLLNQTFKGRSQGSNIAMIIDYFFRERWSFSAAFGYNRSLDTDNFGLEGFGMKLGLSYCFY